MKMLIACKESQIVTKHFRRLKPFPVPLNLVMALFIKTSMFLTFQKFYGVFVYSIFNTMSLQGEASSLQGRNIE